MSSLSISTQRPSEYVVKKGVKSGLFDLELHDAVAQILVQLRRAEQDAALH